QSTSPCQCDTSIPSSVSLRGQMVSGAPDVATASSPESGAPQAASMGPIRRRRRRRIEGRREPQRSLLVVLGGASTGARALEAPRYDSSLPHAARAASAGRSAMEAPMPAAPFAPVVVPPLAEQAGQTFPRLVELMRRLLAPGGCPWDREQTLGTLRRYV